MPTEPQTPDKRTGTRIPANQPVYFSDTTGWGDLCRGALINQSSGGLSIKTDTLQPVGTLIDVELLPTPENHLHEAILSKGEIRTIRKSESGTYILGIKTLYAKPRKPHKTILHFPDHQTPKPGSYKTLTPTPQLTRHTPKPAPKSPQKTSPYTEIKKPLILAGLLLLALLLLLPSSQTPPSNHADRPSGISYAHAISTLPEPLPDTTAHTSAPLLYGAQNSAEDNIEMRETAPPYIQKPKDSFLFASLALNPSTPKDGSNSKTSGLGNQSPDDAKSLPSVKKLARDLEKAQSALRSGDRMTAMYLTRNATETLSDLPEPWQDILRQFRSSLISRPNEIPALPKLDDWITLSTPLKDLPTNAPIVVYIDKDNFTMHVLNNGETIWQFPIGLGAKDSTPEGTFTIGTKIANPDWYNKGNVVPAGSPANPLGNQWMGLSDQNTPLTYGMHPTSRSESIGEALSKGCIRMRPQDAQKLFNMLPVGTPIVIRSGAASPKL